MYIAAHISSNRYFKAANLVLSTSSIFHTSTWHVAAFFQVEYKVASDPDFKSDNAPLDRPRLQSLEHTIGVREPLSPGTEYAVRVVAYNEATGGTGTESNDTTGYTGMHAKSI